MRVALIGSKGQLGQDLVRTVPEKVELTAFTHGDFDITERDDVFDFIAEEKKFDAVINTAAFHKTDLCEDQPEKAFLVNAVGIKNLAQACKKTGAVLLHISTDYVFDGKKIKNKEPYTEEDIPNPINIYGISKYAGELIVQNYLERYYIIRTASLYGKAGASGKGGNFVYTIINKAKNGEPLKVIDDICMSPTYTYDLAKKIWEILTEEKPYGIYHITNSGYCSWYEFALKILEYAGLTADIKPVKHTEFKTKAKRPLWSPLSSKRDMYLRTWDSALYEFIESIRLQL